MTQIIGYYCSNCRIRYVANVCTKVHEWPDGLAEPSEGLPCRHDREGAQVIYCYSWLHHRFELQGVVNRGQGLEEIESEHFEIEYDDPESNAKFLDWLKTKQGHEWEAFMGAYLSLRRGGRGLQFTPNWREKQLVNWRARAKAMEEKRQLYYAAH